MKGLKEIFKSASNLKLPYSNYKVINYKLIPILFNINRMIHCTNNYLSLELGSKTKVAQPFTTQNIFYLLSIKFIKKLFFQ